MKSKPRFLDLIVLVFLLQTRPAHPKFVKEELKNIVLERKSGTPYDYFTLNMKVSHRCSSCISAQAVIDTSKGNSSSCSCICWTPQYSFRSSDLQCTGVNQSKAFGGCNSYFDPRTLLANYPVDLSSSSKKVYHVFDGVDSCDLNGQHYYDYNGFQSKWKTANGFFTSKFKRSTQNLEIKWQDPSATDKVLFGRIIRLNVSCTKANPVSSFTRCILLKAIGSVTYYAPSSSSTSTSYQDVSSTPSGPHIPVLSSTSFAAGPWSTASTQLPSLSPTQSVSLSSTIQYLSPQSSVLSSSWALPPQPSSRILSLSTQIRATKLPEVTPGQIETTVSTKDQSLLPVKSKGSTNNKESTTNLHHSTSRAHVVLPIKPSKPITASSSTAGDVGPGDKGASSGGNDSGTIIGAAVGGAVLLAVLVICIIIVWRRRKAWKSKDQEGNPEKTNKHMKNPVYGSSENEIQLDEQMGRKTKPSIAREDQPTYQGLIFGDGQNNGAAVCSSADDDYDNCTVYQDLNKQIPETPAYLGLSKGLPEGAPTTEIPNSRHSTMPDPKLKPSAGGIPSSKANGTIGVLKSKSATERPKRGPIIAQEPVYNVLDGPGTGPRTTTEPLYNVLEGHEYATPNVDSLYNVLEGPDSSQSVPKSGPNTTEEAVYNVVESPDATNGPTNKQGTENDAIYNVLEAPDSDKNSVVAQGRSGPGNDPLYSVLEEQVGDGSKQNAPNKSSSIGGVANPAYEQTLDFGASYAAVQRPGTRGESLYEPLRRPGQDVYEPLG